MQREASFNDLFNATFEQIAANRTATLIFLAVTVPAGAASVALFETALLGGAALIEATTRSLGTGAAMLASFVFGMIAQYWFAMALLRRSLRADFGRLLPYMGISLLSLFGVILGFALLLIPGLILITRWVLVTPMVIDRDMPAMDSFVESWERTQSSAWAIFGVIAVFFVLMLIPSGIGALLSDQLAGSVPVAGWLLESFASQINTVFSTAMMVGTYRLIGEDHRELEEIFA